MNRPTPELIEKIKQAETEEELIALAKENGVDLYNTDGRTRYEWMKHTYISLKPKANKIIPDLKYKLSAYRFRGDYGTRHNPVPKGRVRLRLFGVDFLVSKKRLPMLKRDLKNPLVLRFLADFAISFNHSAMFIGINNKGKPYISSSAIIHEPERFNINGITVVTVKGTFDINDRKDRALLRKLTNRFINLRVKLEYIYEGGGYEDYRTMCIIPYRVMHGDEYDYFTDSD